MKRVSCVAVGVVLSFIWIPLVSAGTNNGLSTQNQQGQMQTSVQNGQVISAQQQQSQLQASGQNGQFRQPGTVTDIPGNGKDGMEQEGLILTDPIIPPKAGIPWKERVVIQRAIHKRAEASRIALLRQAALDNQNQRQPAKQQVSPVLP
jgi:hypothetical protein